MIFVIFYKVLLRLSSQSEGTYILLFIFMWVILMLLFISVLMATMFLIIFIRAVKSGQYDDMYTPSVRMLFDDKFTEEEKN